MVTVIMYGDQSYAPLHQLRIPQWYGKNSIEGKENFLFKDILENGVKRPIVVNNFEGREGIIIDGVQTYKISKALGIFDIPIFLIDVPAKEEGKFHVLFNTSQGENSREKMIELMKKEYFSYFEADDEILTHQGLIEKGRKALRKIPKPVFPGRKVICNLPEHMKDYPDRGMEILGCKSINEVMIEALKGLVEGSHHD